MVITSIEPCQSNRYKVCMEDGTHLILYKGEVRRYHLSESMELSQSTYEELFYEVLGKRVKKRAMALLEKQDRTEAGLRRKLAEGDYPEQLIEDAIAYVKKYHYIDDRRYAQNYVSYHQQGRSRLRLKQDLMKRGVPSQIAECVLEEMYEQQEEAKILRLLQKKNYDPENADRKEQQRIYGYLARAGFSSGDILRAMKCTDHLTS
ncbi:MAG: recombination regulator RecX [Lachnospiraceae bacterium]|nr:recombination regulator RecX [Lachnospiraceae bacterium]